MRLLALFLIFIASALAQKKPITLAALAEYQEASAKQDGPPVWAPDGKSFVFERAKTLVIYDPAAKSSRELVSTEPMNAAAAMPHETRPFDWTNRRVAADSSLQWSPSGKELLYETSGDLFLIHIETGKWDQITKTPEVEHDPKFSPDRKMLAFRRGFDLYALELTSGKETRLTRDGTATLINAGLDWVYPEELELGTAFWWSPDSKSIAYLQFDTSREPVYPHEDLLHPRAIYEPQRYPQAGDNNADVHLGVVPAAGGTTRWIDVGDTRISFLIPRAGWMPNSSSVYTIRMNRLQNKLEMFSTNVESGTRTAIFTESDPYWINTPGDAYFLPDGRHFLWTSERDGFRHIYRYSNDGKDGKQLTKGPWEVRGLLEYNDQRVFYTSNEGDTLETHLYSIKLDGTDKRRLDRSPGTHEISMSPAGAFYLDTASSLTSPRRTTLHSGDGAELGVYRDFAEEYDVLPTQIVKFKGPDGTELHGRFIKPAGFEPGKKYPVIVGVYGGPGVDLPVENSWPGINMDQVYAHQGYVVWHADNRGGSGRGHAFETPIFRKLGVAELADQIAGVKYLISLGFVDPEKIGITGWSYGGFMTLNALLNAPDVFKCGIAGAPVTNFLNYDTIYTERYMGLPAENADGYAQTALAPKANNLRAKLMILHNFEDDNVLFQNTMQIIAALEEAGKPFELGIYPQKTHPVDGNPLRQMNARILDFFERNLKF